jgi:hypothetical protein
MPKTAPALAHLVGKTLRRFSAYGPCLDLYGVVVSATDKTVTYRTERGDIKRAGGYDWHSNGSRPLGQGLLHTDACPSCRDHARTQYPEGYMN